MLITERNYFRLEISRSIKHWCARIFVCKKIVKIVNLQLTRECTVLVRLFFLKVNE